MIEIAIPAILFAIWTTFSVSYIQLFKRKQTDPTADKSSWWNNEYIFEAIPPVFPTLGIFCTALGITIGIWNFKVSDIQGSIQLLLEGLKLAFIATMAGIIGLIIFQKYLAIIKKQIDDHPDRPRRQTDELSALSELSHSVESLKIESSKQAEKLISTITNEIEQKISLKLASLDIKLAEISKAIDHSSAGNSLALTRVSETIHAENEKLRGEQIKIGEKANKNADEIIKAMFENNKLTSKKFDEFSLLLSKNNTEALVHVMKNATEQFSAQMSELINRLVQENFKELNTSVKSLNDWQKENKQQIHQLTENFKKTAETFEISSKILKEVAVNTNALIDDNGKLGRIVKELSRVMIEDGKLQEIIGKLTTTVDTLFETTESFGETTSKLNDWVKNEKSFKDAAQILIKKLEEFRDFNGDVWDKYRKEMTKSVSIVKETSVRLSEDLENINAEFYERLNNTLSNLDQCIQRFLPPNKR